MTPSAIDDDLLTPEAIADPYPLFARLRHEDPVHWSEVHNAWLVSRYDDVNAAFKDVRLSSDRVRPLLRRMDEEQRRAHAGGMLEMIAEWMVLTDPPAHTRLRKLASGAFMPHRINALESRIAGVVDELLDRFVAESRDDLILHFAYPLPAIVISELLGAPPEDRDRFRLWSDELALVAFGAGGEARADRHERAARGLAEMTSYFDELIERARRAPGDDMLSRMLEPDETGDRLSHDELRAMAALMLFAGHETTTTLLASGLLALMRHPDQLARLRADPALTPKAIEELLRYDGPVKVLIRWVVEDFELHGREIRRGERVFLLPASANRDAARFPHPDTLDIGRTPNAHVAFGKGIHTCIGALLARVEGRVAFPRMLDRLRDVRLAECELRWEDSLASRSLQELHVVYDA